MTVPKYRKKNCIMGYKSKIQLQQTFIIDK